MWRHLTKQFQQRFKKSICFEKFDKCIEDGKTTAQQVVCFKELFPCAYQHLNPNILKYENVDHNQSDHDKSNSKTRPISHYTIFEAFGWSGALICGWVISKQLWLTQTWRRDEDTFNNKTIIFPKHIIQFLTQVVKTQPPAAFILPQCQTTIPIKAPGSKLPSNLDDEFETAAKELQEVHNKAIGESLNRRGIACLSQSTGSEAMKYFRRASELKYPPASFNMGQCCELGIGTKQDFKKAAEWYKIASQQGHATAMYNLGVFYVHGWGGLQADIDTAKKLFANAANLGQPDAKAALDKESKATSKLIYKTDNPQISLVNGRPSETKLAYLKSTELNYLVNNLRSGYTNSTFQRELIPENNWDISVNSTVAY